MTAFLKAVVVNTVFLVIFWLAYRAGYVEEAWSHDIAFIIPAVLGTFLLGIVCLVFNISYSQWTAETLIVLGFLGTLLGIWTAFSSIEASQIGDINSIGNVLATLLQGLGAALWTTITGAFFSVWLSANIEVMES